MRGVWSLHTTTLDPGLALVIFDGLAGSIASICTINVFYSKKARLWPENRTLKLGMLFLSSYLVLHWTDYICRHCKVDVTYRYIFFGCFCNFLKALADIFILWGLMIYIERISGNLVIDTWWTSVGAVLSFFAFYHISLLFSLAFAWLAVVDLHTIQSIAKARNAFEIVFVVIYFYPLSFTTCMALVDPTPRQYSELKLIVFFGSICLCIRSFCEVVIVGQLDRWPDHLTRILRARDVTYGLFSVLTILPIMLAMVITPTDDTLLEEDETARKEVMNMVMTRYADLTDNGRTTAPPIKDLLNTVKEDIKSESRTHPIDDQLWKLRTKRHEINRMKNQFKYWIPIFKWQGAEDGDISLSTIDVQERPDSSLRV